MKVVIFHADIEYLVRMGKKNLKQIQWAKKQKKKKEKKTPQMDLSRCQQNSI